MLSLYKVRCEVYHGIGQQKNFLSPRPSVNKSGAPNFFIQHDKVEDSKLRRYLETFGRALEQFLQRRTSSTTPLSSYSACRSTDW